jgi:cytochrome c oxidase accessory protein FixG
VGTDQLYDWVGNPPSEHPTAFFFVVLFTGLVWFNFTYFREQTCLIVCPYGRWQAALIDRQSVIVAYDYVRGEPRMHASHARDPKAGDCIDCGACVQTCPTGIDIRNGLQMECVHCTQCIDACDDIMTRVGKPTGLIRYSSQDAIAGKPRQLVRMRTILYPVVLTFLIGGLITALLLKESADLTVLRGGLDGPFTEEADGRIANQIRVKITNRGRRAMSYTFTLDGLTQAGLRPDEITVVAPENPLPVAAGATHATSLFVLIPRAAFTNGERMITISVTDGRRYQESVNYRLLGPVGNAPTGKFR